MKKNLLIILGVLALASCAKEGNLLQEQKDVNAPSEEMAQSMIDHGSVIIKVTEELANDLEQSAGMLETKSSVLNSTFREFGVTKYERVFDSDPRWVERERREGMHLYYRLSVCPELAVTTKAAGELSQVPGIENVELVFKKKLLYTTTPNDQYFNREWHLYNSSYSGYDLNVRKVWSEFTQGKPNVIVNVVDGGIKPDHPDLLFNVIPGGAGGSKNFVTNKYTITGHFHGTHVGGTIAATTNNGTGVAGIAGGDYALGQKGVQLLCSQVFTDDNSAYSFANAIKYGADNGAVISQNSWGYDFDTNRDYKISQSEYQNAVQAAKDFPNTSEAKAIDYFIKYAGCDNNGNQLPDSPMKGGIVFFSAGNDNIDVGVPAIYEPCVAVGAYAINGKKASFSNYGDWVDICAPGESIYNTSCGDYGTYCYMSGTSMSCPMVSGVAALLISYRGGQGFTNELLKEALLKSADDKIPSSKIGPMINAYNAMLYKLENPPSPLTNFTAQAQSNSITCTWAVQAKEKGGPVDAALVCASKNKSSIENINPANPAQDVKVLNVSTSGCKVGETATGNLTNLEFDATYYVTVIPYNTGAYAPVGSIKSVVTGKNNPPVITPQFESSDLTLRASETKEFKFKVIDPDNHKFSIDYTKANDCEKWYFSDTDPTVLIASIPAPQIQQTGRSYTTKLRVKDSYGAETTYDFQYYILENHPPVVEKEFENIVAHVNDNTLKLSLEDKFSDPDGDELSYIVSTSNTLVVRGKASNKMLEISFVQSSGEAKITVTAKDGRGATASQTIQVLVRPKGEEISVFPTQITDKLNIGTGLYPEKTLIEIYAQTGALVLTKEVEASAFAPAVIDMSAIAPGRYILKVTTGGNTYTKTIIKL